jgi:hypothetical protein
LGLPPGTLLIGLIGRYHPVKDHANFLRAAAILRKKAAGVHFLLAGRGVDGHNTALHEQSAALGLLECTHLLGERNDMFRITAALDIATSSSSSEGFPNVIGEAMSCGVPLRRRTWETRPGWWAIQPRRRRMIRTRAGWRGQIHPAAIWVWLPGKGFEALSLASVAAVRTDVRTDTRIGRNKRISSMCGIAGFWDSSGSVNREEMARRVERMSGCLIHRGPDGGGIWLDPGAGIALGHRRLSILDLSADGSQPMASRCGRYVISFNGEVYNHRHCGKSSPPQAHLPGTSDTEVMLAAIAEWGIERALERFNGMFACRPMGCPESAASSCRIARAKAPIMDCSSALWSSDRS